MCKRRLRRSCSIWFLSVRKAGRGGARLCMRADAVLALAFVLLLPLQRFIGVPYSDSQLSHLRWAQNRGSSRRPAGTTVTGAGQQHSPDWTAPGVRSQERRERRQQPRRHTTALLGLPHDGLPRPSLAPPLLFLLVADTFAKAGGDSVLTVLTESRLGTSRGPRGPRGPLNRQTCPRSGSRRRRLPPFPRPPSLPSPFPPSGPMEHKFHQPNSQGLGKGYVQTTTQSTQIVLFINIKISQ